MSHDWINIGSTPCEEPCIQVGTAWAHRNREETVIYKRQLEREFPRGVFHVKANQHDFGTYYDVEARLGGGDEQDEAAWLAESESAPKWDAEALADLRAIMGDKYFNEIRTEE